MYNNLAGIRRFDLRIKLDLLCYFLDPTEVSKFTKEKKNSPGKGRDKERKAIAKKVHQLYTAVLNYKDEEAVSSTSIEIASPNSSSDSVVEVDDDQDYSAVLGSYSGNDSFSDSVVEVDDDKDYSAVLGRNSGNSSPHCSSDSSERLQTANRFEYYHTNQSPTVSAMQVNSCSQFLNVRPNGEMMSEKDTNELEIAKSGHAPSAEMDEDGYNGIAIDNGDDEDASDHHSDEEDASEHHGDEEDSDDKDSDDKDSDDDEDCFDDSNQLVTETNRRFFTRSVAASRLLRKGVIEMQLNFDDEIASDSVEKRPLFTQFVKSKDLDKTPYDDSTSGLTSGSPDPKEEENVFCFEYIVCIKNGKTNNWVKNGTGTGFPKVCCSRYATVYPGKVLFIW